MKSKNTTTSIRLVQIDLIRVIAMVMVVILHTILAFTLRPDFFPSKLWFLFEPIIALSKTGVVLFFMVSGYLTVRHTRPIKENLEKVVWRIGLPLVVFQALTIAYAYIRTGAHYETLGDFAYSQFMRLTRFPSSPLWFLEVLLFLSMLNPVWQWLFYSEKTTALARYVTALAFAFSVIVTVIQYPSDQIESMFNFFTAWTGFLCFYLYGALIQKGWLKQITQNQNLLLITLGLLLTIVGDYYTSWATKAGYELWWVSYSANYRSIPVVVLSIGLFNLLSNLQTKHCSSVLVKAISFLASVSYGVYLVHTFVVSALSDYLRLNFDTLGINVYLYNALNFFVVLSVSIVITFVIKKTPVLKKAIGE